VQVQCNANRVWYRYQPGQIRIGLIGKNSHPISVNIIGGISRKGKTELIIFDNAMNSVGFQQLLGQFLNPFIIEKYTYYHRLHMDNAKPHKSVDTLQWMRENNINHYPTPAQSPNLNPIELVWHDLKVFLHCIYFIYP
jgi:hypothetical protein